MRETTVSLISKEQIDYLKDDEKFIEFIKNELTRSLSERVMRVLEAEGDIIIKKPVLRVSDYPPTHSVEYRKTLDWEPLVRCKDCKHSDHWYKDKRRCFLWHEAGIDVFEGGFCSYGERRDDAEKVD